MRVYTQEGNPEINNVISKLIVQHKAVLQHFVLSARVSDKMKTYLLQRH